MSMRFISVTMENIEQKRDGQMCISTLDMGGFETRRLQGPHFWVSSNLTVRIILQDIK